MEQLIDFGQLGVSGVLVALLFYLYQNERKDRIKWQDRAFEVTSSAQRDLFEAHQISDRVVSALTGKA